MRPRKTRPAHRPGPQEPDGSARPDKADPPPTVPDQPSSFEQGQTAFRKGEITQAIRHFEQYRAEQPGSPRVHRWLGKCYFRVGQTSRGKQAYRRYLELRPDADDRAFIESIVGG